jgi:hypothetical protein
MVDGVPFQIRFQHRAERRSIPPHADALIIRRMQSFVVSSADAFFAATSAASCLGRRRFDGLIFCRFGLVIDCSHRADASEQGQRCCDKHKFLHVRFTSLRVSKELIGKLITAF